MYFRMRYHSQILYERIFCRYLKMPFYAVIFKTSKAGAIAENWEIARELRDATPNSYAKKFSTKLEAEKYIKDFSYKIVHNTKSTIQDGGTNNYGKSSKRKRLENPNISDSSPRDHIKKIKMAFNELQVAVTYFSGLSATCVDQIKNLNDEVCQKLHEILNVNEIESNGISLAVPTNSGFLHGNLTFNEEKNSLSSLNLDCSNNIDLLPSELEAAKKMFSLNVQNEVIVYTDGACSNNGYNGASAGAGVWFGNGHPLNLSMKVPGTQTNNNAEIFSTIKAIELVKATGVKKLNIHTDSDFVIKSVNEWMPRWQANGWKTSAGAEVKNKEMFLILHQRIKSMNSVNWTYVPGHKGIIGNEEADKLARIGAKM